jgi:hypothetical protein
MWEIPRRPPGSKPEAGGAFSGEKPDKRLEGNAGVEAAETRESIAWEGKERERVELGVAQYV